MRQSLLSLAVASVLLGGCSLIPDYQRPDAPVDGAWPQGAAYTANGAAQTDVTAAALGWREFFKDPALQQLVEAALANNRDLRIAALNVDAYRAQHRIQRAELFPSISVAGSGTRQRLPGDLSSSGEATTSGQYSATVGTSAWEIDFFGRLRSLDEQALELYFASEEAQRSTQISLVASVANAYLTLQADQQLLQLTRNTLDTYRKSYALTERSFNVGVADALSLSQARTAVQSAEASLAQYNRLVAQDRKQHAGIMNTLEGFFMIGVLSAYWIFGYFIDSNDPASTSWLNVYWVLSVLCVLTFVLVLFTRFDESEAIPAASRGPVADFLEMLRLFMRPLVCVFVLTAFLYVLIEQSVGTWLPTFNNEILKLPAAMSVQVTSIFAFCLAVGRLSAGFIMRRLNWFPVMVACVLGMGATILLALPLSQGIAHDPNVSWSSAPLAAFVFPLIGLFMAPIYPGINSVMLSSLPKDRQAPMTGLLVIFSALGGTTGSLITGYVFGRYDGQFAFYLTLVPIALVLCGLVMFRRQVERGGAAYPAPAGLQAADSAASRLRR